MAAYKGPVVFVHPDGGASGTQGVHYPVGDDGHADTSRPLFWDAETGGYRDQKPGDLAHFDAYHQNHVDVIPETGGEPIQVTDAEAESIRAHLAELRGGGSA